MRVGFTGTRHGMSDLQKEMFRACIMIHADRIREFHHGSCQGADVEAAAIVREECPDCRIVAHPGPAGTMHRALSWVDDETRGPKGYLDRNRDIVSESDMVIAAPFEDEPQQRGGTWYTIRHAEKSKKPVGVIPRGPIAPD